MLGRCAVVGCGWSLARAKSGENCRVRRGLLLSGENAHNAMKDADRCLSLRRDQHISMRVDDARRRAAEEFDDACR